jgi:Tol biopolymer transport system component
LVQITDATGSVDAMPDWSPDRTTIVFARQVNAQADIYVVSAEGMDERRLSNSPSSEVQPRWSPDGTKILFASDEMGSNDIWVMDSDGSHALRLTHEAADAFDAVWSPDGDRIAYSVVTATSVETWTMGTDGSDRARVIEGRGSPSYSPDGSLIVLGGLDIVEVATGEVIRSLAVGAEGDIHAEPTWSADGRWIAYRSGPFDADAEIYIVSADGTDNRQVTDNQTLDGFPDWS